MKCLEKGVEFLKELTNEDKVLVYFDADGDGICSGCLMSEYLDEHGIENRIRVKNEKDRGSFKEVFEGAYKDFKFTKFISTDLSIKSEDLEWFKEKKIPALVVDHHSLSEDVPEIVTYVNPKLEEKDQDKIPASAALALYLYEKAGGQKDLKWVGYHGSYTDLVLNASLPYLNLSKTEMEKFNPNGQSMPLFGLGGVFSAPYLDNELGMLTAELMKEAVKENDPLYFWKEKEGKARKIFDTLDAGDKEVRYWWERFNKSEGLIDNENKLVVFKMQPKLQIKRNVSMLLKQHFPNYTIMSGIEDGENIYFSCRSYTVNLAETIKEVTKHVPDSYGGGHPKASGCKVPVKHEEEFLELFKKEMKKHAL